MATIGPNTGLATAVAAGTAKITATMGTVVSLPGTLTVSPVLQSIAVTPSNSSIAKDAKQQFTAIATYDDGSKRDVTTSATWTSGDASIAAVGPTTGLASGVASGATNITASVGAMISPSNPLNVAPPAIDLPLMVDRKVISGTADKSSQYVEVSVYDSTGACKLVTLAHCTPVAFGQANVNDAGRFSVDLGPIPGAKTCVFPKSGTRCKLGPKQFAVVQALPASSTTLIPSSPTPVFAASDTYDESPVAWGEITPIFSTGFVLSQNNGQFSQYNYFLGLLVDNSWHVGSRYRIDAFSQAQLTSIPAASCQSSSSSGTTSGTTTSAASCLDVNSAVSNFISSPKAAIIQGGVFFPYYHDSWKWSYNGDSNTFFMAPIVKGGFETVSNTSQTTSSAPGTSSTNSTLNGQSLYRNASFGFRLGHYKLSNFWNLAPLLLSHVDFTVGKWSSFDQCPNSGCITNANGNITNLSHPWLFAVEGQLKVPSTPFFVGFNTTTQVTASRLNDFRFTFGMQVDVACLLTALTGNGTKLNSSGSCDKSKSDQSSSTAAATNSAAAAAASKQK